VCFFSTSILGGGGPSAPAGHCCVPTWHVQGLVRLGLRSLCGAQKLVVSGAFDLQADSSLKDFFMNYLYQ
jgi:methyl coenzyme M reductase beta subunit